MLVATGMSGLVLGLVGCGDDKYDGGGASTSVTTPTAGTTTEDTATGATTTVGTTTGEDARGTVVG